jgi:hypothetical protein
MVTCRAQEGSDTVSLLRRQRGSSVDHTLYVILDAGRAQIAAGGDQIGIVGLAGASE